MYPKDPKKIKAAIEKLAQTPHLDERRLREAMSRPGGGALRKLALGERGGYRSQISDRELAQIESEVRRLARPGRGDQLVRDLHRSIGLRPETKTGGTSPPKTRH